jgi:hypothetical protein
MWAGCSATSECSDGCRSASIGGLLLGVGFGTAGLGGRRWNLLADLLAIIVADHYHKKFGFLRRDDPARHLRPFAFAAPAIADQTGIGAVLAHDGNFGVLGKRIFKAIGKPIGVRIAYDHDRGCGLGLLL